MVSTLTERYAALSRRPNLSYAVLYTVLATLLSVVLFMSYPVFRGYHEHQHYLYGLTFSALYKEQTLPENILRHVKKGRQYRYADAPVQTKKYKRIALKEEKRKRFTPKNKLRKYSRVNYFPQIIAGSLGEFFGLSPHNIFMLTRGICLFLGVVGGAAALYALPRFHLPVFLVLLLPAGWFMRIQQYPDHILNMASLAYFTLLVRTLYLEKLVNNWQILWFTLAALVTSLSKLVYAPLVASMLLIRKGRFEPFLPRWAVIGSIVIACTMMTGPTLWKTFYQSYHLQSALHSIDKGKPRGGLAVLLHHPTKVAQKIYRSYLDAEFLQHQARGIFLWNLAPPAFMQPMGVWVYIWGMLLFVGVSRCRDPVYYPDVKARLLLVAVIVLICVLIAAVLFLNEYRKWSHLDIIFGVQGRYYIPLLPFMTLLTCVAVPPQWYRRWVVFSWLSASVIWGAFWLSCIQSGFVR